MVEWCLVFGGPTSTRHHSTIRHSHGGEQVEPQAHGPEQGRRAITSTPLESQLLSRLRQESVFFEALHESAIDDLMDVHLRDLGIGPRDILSRPCFLNRPLSTATHMGPTVSLNPP